MNDLEELAQHLDHHRKLTCMLGLCVFTLVVIGDYITPEEITFSVFYLIPIAVFAWFFGRAAAWVVAIASALVWPSEHVVRGDFAFFGSFIVYWELGVRIGFYAVFIVSLSTIQGYLRRLRSVNAQLSTALAEVKQLKGLLPICSTCKRIRDDSNHWVAMEKYIQARTDARFTHGLCPECAQKLYPDLYDKISRKG